MDPEGRCVACAFRVCRVLDGAEELREGECRGCRGFVVFWCVYSVRNLMWLRIVQAAVGFRILDFGNGRILLV